MHGEFGILDQTHLNIVSPGDDPQQARVCGFAIIGVVNQHSQFATDALKACRNRQRHAIAGVRL
jgi:hypothetical protein